MAKNIDQIATALGATVVGQVSNTGGAFGAARLANTIENVQARLQPGQGIRPGRPTNAEWVQHPKVPMSNATKQRLIDLAMQSSQNGRKVSAMQVAAQILEEVLATTQTGLRRTS
jgi:hypothetical protein